MPPCPECRYGFDEGRAAIAERSTAFDAWADGLLSATDPYVLRRRPAPRTWSPLEYAAHVSEVLPWYAGRVRLVLEHDRAQLTARGWAALTRDLGEVRRDLHAACAELADLAGSLTAGDLAREGVGSDGTPRSIETLLARAGHELAHHELDLRRGVRPLPGLSPPLERG